MRLVPVARERWQKIGGEFAKFGTIGLINIVVNYAVFNALVLTVFPQGQLKANVVATVVATTSSYFMNRHWTFRDRPKSTLRREYTLFFAFNLAGLLIELSVLGLAKYGLGLTSLLALNAAKTIGVGIGTVFRFWAYRTFVFAHGLPAAVAPAVPAQQRPAAAEIDEVSAELEAELMAELAAETAKLAPAPPARTPGP